MDTINLANFNEPAKREIENEDEISRFVKNLTDESTESYSQLEKEIISAFVNEKFARAAELIDLHKQINDPVSNIFGADFNPTFEKVMKEEAEKLRSCVVSPEEEIAIKLLIAVAEFNFEEAERLSDLLKRMDKAGMTIMK